MSPDPKDPKQPKQFLKNIAWITLDFTLYNEATVIKIGWSSRKTDIDKWNLFSPEINPHSYGQLIYNKGS